MTQEAVIKERVAAATQNLKERDYWLSKLSGELTRAAFPYQYRETCAGQQESTGSVSFPPGEALEAQLKKLSNGFDYSLHMILVTAVLILLERYSGSRDIIVGAPIYKQEVEGNFINTILALRGRPAPDMTVKDLLLQVRETVVEATANQNYPIETLLYKLDLGSDTSGDEFPLFDVAVLLESIHDPEYIRHLPLNMVFTFKGGNRMEGRIEYNTSRYGAAFVQQIARHLENLMRQALFNLDTPLGDLGILGEEEKQQLVYGLNDTGYDHPEDKTITALFREQAARTPDAAALFFEDRSLSYAELDRGAGALARHLVQKGVEPGDIVALMAQRSFDMILGMLGILKAGAAYLPIDPQHPQERIKYVCSDSGARFLLAQEHLPRGMDLEIDIEFIPPADTLTAAAEPGTPPLPSPRPESTAYIIYTSGSTGKAKGVVVEHRSIINTLLWRKDYYSFAPGDVILQVLGFTFDSSVEDIFTTLISGAALTLVPQANVYDLQYLSRVITGTRVTYLLIVPGFYKSFLAEIPGALTGLRAVTVAGDNITEPLVAAHYRELPQVRLFNEYGPTENSVCSTVYEFPPLAPRVLIGKPVHNVYCYILDALDRPAPLGVPGELCVSGRGLARGYLERPELTREKFIANPFVPGSRMYRTGDLARLLEDGNIEFLGRIDYQVKIRGFRIELGEIENRLLNIAEITEAVVVARDSDMDGLDNREDGDKYLCAYVTAETELSAAALKETLATGLPDYMVPAYFVQLEQLPLTPNGKIDRKALPVPEADKKSRRYVPPRNRAEEKMVDIWSQVLKVDSLDLGIEADFFDEGGHSLKATVLVSRIHKEFSVKLPMAKVFEHPTIEAMTGYITEEALEDPFDSIRPAAKKDGYTLSSPQKRLYILQRMSPETTVYNIYEILELQGELDQDKLQETFLALIRRHESLRTSFHMERGTPVQRVHEPGDIQFRVESLESPAGGGAPDAQALIGDFLKPFDLGTAPLLRAGLVNTGAGRHVLVVDMHHIISDGVSHRILLEEFPVLYRGGSLPELPLQYKDYAEWRQSSGVIEQLKPQEDFWLKQMSGGIPQLHLPTDYPRPEIQRYEGAITGFQPAEGIEAALRQTARNCEATMYMVLAAVYNVFLSRLTGSEDILVGTPVAGRRHADLEHTIGMFVNTLVLRNRPEGELTFQCFLEEVKRRTLDAFDNQDYPFEDLVEQVTVDRDAGRNPIFDVMFVGENIFDTAPNPGDTPQDGLTIRPYAFQQRTSKFDLSLFAVERAGKLQFAFEYSTHLFKQETIQRFTRLFHQVVSALMEQPDQRLSELDILPEEDRQEILHRFNNTAVDFPAGKTIGQLFEEQAARSPHRPALHGQVSGGGASAQSPTGTMTYGQLDQCANHLALQLRGQGVKPGKNTALCAEPSMEMTVAILAVLKAGGAYVPIEPTYPDERIAFMLKDTGACVLLSRFPLDTRHSFDGQYISLEGVSSPPADAVAPPPKLNQSTDLAYIMYTSGSTGKPKGAMVEHRNVVRLVVNNTFVPLNDDTCVLQTGAPGFDAVTFEMWGPLLNGGQLVLTGRETLLDTGRLAEAITTYKVNTLWLTSPLFNRVTRDNPGTFGGLTYLVVGGDVLSPRYINRARGANPGLTIINGYGPTENTTFSTTFVIDREFTGPIPIGRPISNSTAIIVDDYGRLQPIGIFGELWVGGYGVCRGYLNRDNLTEEKFVTLEDGEFPSSRFYKTGDTARWLPDGNIEFAGRRDNQVKIRGFRIETAGLENLLLEHPAITGAAVVAEGGEEAGSKQLSAYIVSTGPDELHTPQLREFLGSKLPDYMLPAAFIQVEHIPLTPNGKVDRKALKAIGKALGSGVEFVAPQDELEKKLAEIWCDILEIEQVGVQDNFFEIGGNSLLIVSAGNRLKELTETDIPVVNLFRFPTIASLADYIKNGGDGSLWSGEENIEASVDQMEETMNLLMGGDNE